MRTMARHALLVGVLVVALAVGSGATPAAGAQEPPSTGMTTQDIVPKPNSGRAPDEAGDRGGALQLLLPVVIAAALGGAVLHLRGQSRRARSSVPTD